jgi:thiamine biosynthesis lipoprotein
LHNFLVNAGGDIAIRGDGPSRDGHWTVGIRHPDEALCFAAVLAVSGPLAVATSATYERGAHIVDPRTGQPTTEVASVTVVGPDLTFADAYATAVFVMGVDGLEWLTDVGDYEGFVITRDDGVFSTAGFGAFRAVPV